MLDSQSPLPEISDYSQRVAQEVAARYGLAVSPAVVQKVAPGVSGLPQPVWDGTKLVYADFQGDRMAARSAWRGRPRGGDERRRGAADPVAHDRRQRLIELHRAGATDTEMSEALETKITVIRADRYALGLRANICPRRQPSTVTQIRMARLAELLAIGASRKQMMADMGITADSLRHLAETAKLVLPARVLAPATPKPVKRAAPKVTVVVRKPAVPRAPAPPKPKPESLRAQRHALLLALTPETIQTLTVAEICAKLGVKPETIREDLRVLKLKAKRGTARAEETVRRQRLDALRRMDVSDLTVRQLMAQFGCSAPVMRKDLAALGLRAKAEAAPGLSAAQEAALAARRDRIRAMVAEGKTRAEIMAAEDIKRLTLVNDLQAMGLTIARAPEVRPRQTGTQSKQALAELRARIRALRLEGLTLKQISDAVGRAPGTVSYHLSTMGMLDQQRAAAGEV